MEPKATYFEFTSYVFEPEKQQILFNYKTEFEGKEPIIFTETILLPVKFDLKHVPSELLKNLLQTLHIILGVSYYKFYCATNIKLPYLLSKQEADFFNTVYKKGLGEFFYKNKLDPNILPKFLYDQNVKTHSWSLEKPFGAAQGKTQKYLVGIGGGKDSIVAAELLKKDNVDITTFVVETNKPSALVDDVIKKIGAPNVKIQRFLDSKVSQLHQYNGHIPVSAVYAGLGIFACVLYKYDYFVVANEHSSNFGNTTYKGLEINHQWSKSLEFETLFSNYVKNSISPDVGYFSLLRAFYEIRIVALFSKYPEYFTLFSSCNRNFTATGNKEGTLWCCQCAKCVFAFTLLSAFLSKKELIQIFGKNLYQDQALLPMFKDILGFGNMKPFDCVGTFDEAQTALYLAKKKFAKDFIVRQLGKKAGYDKEVFKTTAQHNIPEQFAFLGMENVLILGFGKEGKITKQYLKKNYPKLKIGVGDETLDKKYLQKQTHFDIAIKTPGIKKELITIPYTTATNIFFSNVRGKYTIIGVTGSKGKSTTASLIYHILKTAGKNVELLGNIGQPMLQSLLAPIKKETIFVLELSSYQLDDVKFSPDIAVVTNLFPEHLDYHGNLKKYYEAKNNIIHFQTEKQYFVYNEKTKDWLKNYKGQAVTFSDKTYKSNLIGAHNESNIGAAVAVCEILKISDQKIQEGIKAFKGLPHRLENVGTFKNITFYDDAISTTPESTIMAIKSLPNIDTIFLGGTNRGYNFSELEKTIKQYKINNIVLFPESGNKIFTSTKGLNVLKTKSMKEAVAFAYKYTKPGHICLLSCASPSYSLWKNFEEKGDQFQVFVKNLSKK